MEKSKSLVVLGTINVTIWGTAWLLIMFAFYGIFNFTATKTDLKNNELYLFTIITISLLYMAVKVIPEVIFYGIELIRKN